MMDLIRGYPLVVSAIIFVGFSIPIAVYDLRTMKIPDILTYMGLVTLLCYRFACTRKELVAYICTAIISLCLFTLVRNFSKKGLGWGDIKYSALCGLYAGPIVIFIGFVLSAIFCGVYFLILKIAKKYEKNMAVPFAPFMALGTLSVTVMPIIKSFVN